VKRRSHRWQLARSVTALGFLALLLAGAHSDVRVLTGSTTASNFLGVMPFADPLAALQVMLASRAATSELWIGAGALLALAALAGPVFCGWLCPLGLVLDWNHLLRDRVVRVFKGDKHRAARRGNHLAPRGTRSAVLLFVLAVAAFGLPFYEALSPIQLLVRGLAYGTTAGLLVVLGLAVIEWFVPRLWCRTLCPTGALYSLVGRRAPLRVRIDLQMAGKLHCALCEAACPMGIPVMESYTLTGERSVDAPDCIRCGACLDSCPGAVLNLGVRDRN